MTTTKLSTKRRRSNNKFGILLIIIIAACAVGGTAFALSLSDSPETETAEEEIAEETPNEPESEETAYETEEDQASASLNDIVQNEGEDPNGLAELTGSLTYAEKTGDNLVIRVNIDQSLTSGTCQLTLSSAKASVYSAEAPIFSTGSANASCEGFDIPLSALPENVTLTLNIKLTSGDKTGVITGEIKP